MKKLSLAILAIITLISCSEEHPKEYITISGKIENNKDSILKIRQRRNIIKKIKINKDGTFKDTLKVEKSGVYFAETKLRNRFPIHLANGYNLKLTGDSENFKESLKYEGKGAESNKYIVSQIQYSLNTLGKNPMELFALNKEQFDSKISSIEKGLDSVLNLYKKMDTTLLAESLKQNKQMLTFFKKGYEKQHSVALAQAEAKKKTAKGMVSPKFMNYQNFKGGKTSLDNLKGKYVYIDMWATWCGPCKAEIPALQQLEKDYHGKNIEFVSISIDNERTAGSWEKAEKKWKKMVTDMNLTGIQLYAAKDIDFISAYQINSIPRFLLIDPKGNIVDANAPRPSDKKVRDLFSGLGI